MHSGWTSLRHEAQSPLLYSEAEWLGADWSLGTENNCLDPHWLFPWLSVMLTHLSRCVRQGLSLPLSRMKRDLSNNLLWSSVSSPFVLFNGNSLCHKQSQSRQSLFLWLRSMLHVKWEFFCHRLSYMNHSCSTVWIFLSSCRHHFNDHGNDGHYSAQPPLSLVYS